MEKIYVATEQGYFPGEGFYNIIGCYKNENDAYDACLETFNSMIKQINDYDPNADFFTKDEENLEIEAATRHGDWKWSCCVERVILH